ncbi:Antitoxin DinJ [subsurface metagenome]
MAKSATINARIDEKTKTKAQAILRVLNIPMSEAISMFFRQIVLHNGIPFELKIPNELTAKTLEKAEAGEDVYEFSSVDELLEDLKS